MNRYLIRQAQMESYSQGAYCLYADHLAALAEKDKQCKLYLRTNKGHLNTILVLGKQIAALKVERDGAFEKWKSAIAKYPNGGDGCCCLFDKDQSQVCWCSVHAELRDKNAALEAQVKERDNQIRHLHTTNDTLKRENATLTADKNIWHNACNNLDEQVHILTAKNERLRIQLRTAVDKIAEFIHVESHGEDKDEPT